MPEATVHDRYSVDEVAGYYSEGLWRPDTFFELVDAQARARAGDVFIADSTTELTFADLREQVVRLAAGLRRHGVVAGDRVAAQLPNWTEFAVLAAAVSRLGAILVPVMPIYRDDEVGYVLRHSGAKVAVTCEEFRGFGHLAMIDGLREACPELELVVVARPGRPPAGRGAISWADLLAAGEVVQLEAGLGPDTGPDEPFLIVYTSGTTARPKGCFHTVNTVRASAVTIALSLGYADTDVQFGPSPITHSTGLMTSVMMPLLVGARSQLMEVWEPTAALDLIREHRCTVTVTATAFLQMLLGAYDPQSHDASSMRLWVCAGSPIPGAIVERARKTFAGCEVLSLYGRSESFLNTMCTVDDPPERSAESDGRAVGGAEVRVVGPDGMELPRGEEGELSYRGPSHMLGYFHDPEQTAALFTDEGFSRSGDLGRMDADGFVRVTGRLKDIVIRGGLNISARELEELLADHPEVDSVAVVGMPDERLGERVCVYVVPVPGAAPTLESVVAFLRERNLATPKLPERLELLDALPMTATGKVQKHLLRDDVARLLRSGSAQAEEAR